ncbi:nucleoplasmin-like [Nyctibius grandis]|uniref:nucleoplasmin-like n=1 Tax=Nyctibius grandis TaxID=48427 RepID=UPI0035BC6859
MALEGASGAHTDPGRTGAVPLGLSRSQRGPRSRLLRVIAPNAQYWGYYSLGAPLYGWVRATRTSRFPLPVWDPLRRMSSSSPFSRLLSEETPVAALWGCQLNTGSRSCVVKEEDDFLEHLLLLRTICLGADAGDELHVVAVDSKNTYGEHKPVPIAALRTSVLPMISLKGLELVPPVTFVLKCGAGPVYLSGQQVTLEDDAKSEAHEKELSEEDVGDEDDDGAS